MYKFEIHLHTTACSDCAVSSAFEMLDAAKQNGYSGIVITNHFYNGNTCVDRSLPWKDFVNEYKKDYENAKSYGEKLGLKVFFGIEEGYEPGKEMLIYGLSPEILENCPEFKNMSAKEKSEFAHENGGITVCAHPFRDRFYIPNPDTPPNPIFFDGIECFNYFNKDEENDKAFAFAEQCGLIKTSGCDIHNAKDFGKAGIAFEKPINAYSDLLKYLKSGEYKLIIDGKIK